MGGSETKRSDEKYRVVPGEHCPAGSRIVTATEALIDGSLCGLLGDWDIARLADGGSMTGPGYRCEVTRTGDERGLAAVLCVSEADHSMTSQGTWQIVGGDPEAGDNATPDTMDWPAAP